MISEYWSINDIKNVLLPKTTLNVGDRFYMSNDKGEYYFTVLNKKKSLVFYQLERNFKEEYNETITGDYPEKDMYDLLIDCGYRRI